MESLFRHGGTDLRAEDAAALASLQDPPLVLFCLVLFADAERGHWVYVDY
jgi:hypothetical protein